MPTTFTVEFRVPDENGVLTDATGPHASGVPTIGIIRTDTSAVVVADGTAMVRDSLGVYSKSVPAPVAGVTYRATWIAVVDGDTITDQFDLTETDDSGWHYSTASIFKDLFFGEDNTDQATDLDRDDVGNDEVLDDAGTRGDTYIDSRLTGMGWTTPLLGMDERTTRLLRDLSNHAARWQLAESHQFGLFTGSVTADEETRIALSDKQYVDDWLDRIEENPSIIGGTDTPPTMSGDGGFESVDVVNSNEDWAAVDENAG